MELDRIDEEQKTARICEVYERSTLLQKPKVANVDLALLVIPWCQPRFDMRQLDRYLSYVHLAGLKSLIVITKSDLKPETEDDYDLAAVMQLYQSLGYSIVATSIYAPESLEPLREAISGKCSVLAGVSGAGKSSLLNRMHPGLNLKVGEVSSRLERGQHTTRHCELLAIDETSYVADTPGFSQLKLQGVRPKDLELAFPEFQGLNAHCDFNDCLHREEEGCAILTHLEAMEINSETPQIHPERYANYLELVEEAETGWKEQQSSSQKSKFGAKQLDKKGTETRSAVRLKAKHRERSRKTDRQALQHSPSSLEEAEWLDSEENDFV